MWAIIGSDFLCTSRTFALTGHDALLHACGDSMQRVITEVRIAFRGLGLAMSKSFAYQEEACAVGGGERRERISQIVQTHIGQTCAHAHLFPGNSDRLAGCATFRTLEIRMTRPLTIALLDNVAADRNGDPPGASSPPADEHL